jgi:CheY-like chemotaxis protein
MKILIIEDDQSVAELERDYLEISGFACTLCGDGTQGLSLALEEDFALVIVDVMLPGLSGFEICRRIREEKDTPLIIISALADDIDKVRGLGLGADDYMHQADADVIFPMHFWGDFSVCQQLQQHPCSENYRDRIVTIKEKGQSFSL